MATYKLTYGTVTTGRPKYHQGSYRRADTYAPNDGRQPIVENVAAAGPDDDSQPHNSNPGYGGAYNPDCPACWLGHGHTDKYHAKHAKQ